jgi:hypothetical protein
MLALRKEGVSVCVRRFALVWLLALPFFCGCQQGAAPTMPTMTMRLTSTAFQEGETIP